MNEQLFEELGDQIKHSMARYHVPGVAVGVLHEDRVHTAGFGVTNVDNPLAVDEHTRFQIGSITKTFVGTAVMRLVELGKLELDAPVRIYLPDLQLADEMVAARVTLRHLLNHTGGWAGDYFSDTGRGEDALARYVGELSLLPQLAPLGEVWAYNNSGFGIAGRVIEVVTGRTFEQALMELVLEPLGLPESHLFPEDVMTYRFVVGHFSGEETPETQVAHPWALARSAHSAGGIVSNVCDLLRYARFHMGTGTAEDGTQLLSVDALADMQTPHIKANLGNQFGISWFINEIDGVRLIRHGGGTMGQVSELEIAPGRQFAFAILTNSNMGGALITESTKWILKNYLDVEEAEPQPEPRSVEQLEPYVGEYDAQLGTISLALENGELVARYVPKGGFPDKDSPPPPAPPPTRLAFTGPDQIIDLDPHSGSRADFIRDQDGAIRWLRTSRLHVRL